MTPRVSVLLPVRDAADTLPLCLASLRRQTESRFECVLVDDGSRDSSADLALAVAAADDRIRVLRTPARGLVSALGTGLAACSAPVVARMDADDWMHRDRLRLQLDSLDRHPEWAGVGSHVRIFPRAGLRDGRRAYETWLNGLRSADDVRRDRFVECPVAHPTLALRRAILLRHGYRDEGWPEDYDLVLRLLDAGESLGIVPRRLLGWRDGPGRLSRTHPDYELERFTACKAAHLARGFLSDHPRYVLWGYGGTGRALYRALLERGRTPALIVELHPGRLGQTIHGAPVIDPSELPDTRQLPLVASVAGAEARGRIRRALTGRGWREDRDFVCAA